MNWQKPSVHFKTARSLRISRPPRCNRPRARQTASQASSTDASTRKHVSAEPDAFATRRFCVGLSNPALVLMVEISFQGPMGRHCAGSVAAQTLRGLLLFSVQSRFAQGRGSVLLSHQPKICAVSGQGQGDRRVSGVHQATRRSKQLSADRNGEGRSARFERV